jgi:hypothetical protein
MSNSWWVNDTSSDSTQLPVSSRAIDTAMIFGTNESVGSWIWVAAWNSEMRKPTSSAVSRIGAAIIAALVMVRTAIWVTSESVMTAPRWRSERS